MDFEGTMGDEMTVRTGDVVKNVTKSNEEGWLEGELRGKKGIFPANFVKEVPVYLIGDSKREPRSIRKTKRMKQQRKCEVTYAYSPMNEDELELAVGEIIEIIREIEDGWWMGLKNGKVGAFPSNFVKEIFVLSKGSEGKVRPKLADAVFSKEVLGARLLIMFLSHVSSVTECCQVMFDYKAQTDDELALKKGDIVMIISKETEDEGWWEGELNGRRGFFPDNFVMVIPPVDNLQSGTASQPPARKGSERRSDEKPEGKDLRSNPPTKVKLPCINKPSPPPVKDKPNKPLPNKVMVVVHLQAQSGTDHTEPELSPKKPQAEKSAGKQELSLESLQAEIKELRMTLDLLQTQHERDMQEMKEELREERSKRTALQVREMHPQFCMHKCSLPTC
uniref:Osteoclast-stimulating factor 1 n=1 Tax=Myripristis murdjan TaxID=586833 RepID=A0A667Z0K5_9TELE